MENTSLKTQATKEVDEIIQHGYETDSAGYITEAFEIFKSNALNYILYTLLYLVVSSLMSKNQSLQFVVSVLLVPLGFGAFIVANKILKNQTYTFKNFFDGYDRFLDIIIYYIVQLLVVLFLVIPIVAIPFAIYWLIFGISSIQNPIGSGLIFLVLFMVFVFFIAIAIGVLLIFAPNLLWFKNMRAIDALMNSAKIIKIKLPNWIGFFFMIFGINILGALALGVGLLVSMPVSMIAVYIAYERVVGTETMIED